MRRQHFEWTFLVLGLVLTIYGGYSLIYNHIHKIDISILGLIFLIIGAILLTTYLVLVIISLFQRKKTVAVQEPEKVEEIKEDTHQEVIKEEPKKETPQTPSFHKSVKRDYTYSNSRPVSRYDSDTIYVKQVGYGPVLRVTGGEVLDMRTNTYYRIEGDIVKRDGSGPEYEISGNRIRLAFGGYLYEISGSNVNKVYGGFYASISGGIIQTHDLKEKYEISGSLTIKQQLAVVALLFKEY